MMVSWGSQVWKLSKSSQSNFLWIIRSLLLWVSLLSPRGIVSNQWEVSTSYPPYRIKNLNIRKEESSVRSVDFTQELRFVKTRREINSQKVLWNLFLSWVCHINDLIFNLPFFFVSYKLVLPISFAHAFLISTNLVALISFSLTPYILCR